MLPQPMMPSLTSKRRRSIVSTREPSARDTRPCTSGSPTGTTHPTGTPSGRCPLASRQASQKCSSTSHVAVTSLEIDAHRARSTSTQRRGLPSPGGWKGRPRETSGPRRARGQPARIERVEPAGGLCVRHRRGARQPQRSRQRSDRRRALAPYSWPSVAGLPRAGGQVDWRRSARGGRMHARRPRSLHAPARPARGPAGDRARPRL